MEKGLNLLSRKDFEKLFKKHKKDSKSFYFLNGKSIKNPKLPLYYTPSNI